jgi:ABC-type multidrug transport system fused ATPase/permease subunit
VPRLFSDTLANNISFGREVTGHELMRAARLAVLEDDIDRLERGYDTLVGARGVKLSGGQMQRSAAARMFATGADLLVFDDLSSALDVQTEARLWNGIFESGSAAAALVVSHRRPALRRADRIYVMDGGSVAGVGTLDELLEASPLMRELWTAGEPEALR